jgi:hypothetical protein
MSKADTTRPHIRMERGAGDVTHAIFLDLGNGKTASVVIERKPSNEVAIDYFYEKLKDGVNL